MDFVAPPLLGYAGGAGLLEYTGAGAETGQASAAVLVVACLQPATAQKLPTDVYLTLS